MCKVEVCDRKVVAFGMCDPHYRRWRKTGSPGTDAIGRKTGGKPKGRVCSLEGCGKPHKGNGYCHTHNTLFKRNGAPEVLPKRVPSVCAVDGCEKEERGLKGYCEAHLKRIQINGSVGSEPLRPFYPADAVCAVDGCDRPRLARDWCKTHYERWCAGSADAFGEIGQYTEVIAVDGKKNCTGCGRVLPFDQFGKFSQAPDGMTYICFDCTNLLAAKRGRGHAQRAQEVGLDVDAGITEAALRERDGDCCYLCGLEMSFERYRMGNYNPLRASIDHIIPIAKGGTHTWDNVKLACLRCNISKNDSLPEELLDELL